jgi:hypothetical protein
MLSPILRTAELSGTQSRRVGSPPLGNNLRGWITQGINEILGATAQMILGFFKYFSFGNNPTLRSMLDTIPKSCNRHNKPHH